MKRTVNGGTIAVIAVVLMMTLSGCGGLGATGPADDGMVEGSNEPDDEGETDDGASTAGGDTAEEDDASSDASRTSDQGPSNESDGPTNDEDDGATDAGEPTNDGNEVDVVEDIGTSDPDESKAGDGSSADEGEIDDDADDGTTDDAAADDGEVDSEDGARSDDGDGEDVDGGDEGSETDEPVQEYDPSQFTFTAIAYGNDEERPPHSVDVWNTHDRSIDLSGWAVTTTEGGEYVLPEGTTVGSDDTVLVRFGPGELTRDGGTLTLVDARGNVVIEDEYGD